MNALKALFGTWVREYREARAERDSARDLAARLKADNAALTEKVLHCEALAEKVRRVTRALDDEEANLIDDGARLSHAVVRRLRAALTDTTGEDSRG